MVSLSRITYLPQASSSCPYPLSMGCAHLLSRLVIGTAIAPHLSYSTIDRTPVRHDDVHLAPGYPLDQMEMKACSSDRVEDTSLAHIVRRERVGIQHMSPAIYQEKCHPLVGSSVVSSGQVRLLQRDVYALGQHPLCLA